MLLSGCDDSPDSFCGEPQNLDQGIYGQILAKNDAGVEAPVIFQFSIYDNPRDLNEVAIGGSDAQGIYFLKLQPAAYALCAGVGCVTLRIDAGRTIRADLVDQAWTLSPRPGCVH